MRIATNLSMMLRNEVVSFPGLMQQNQMCTKIYITSDKSCGGLVMCRWACVEYSISQTRLQFTECSISQNKLSLLTTTMAILTQGKALLSPAWLCWDSTCLPLQSGTSGRAFRVLWTASPAGGGATPNQTCQNRLVLSWGQIWRGPWQAVLSWRKCRHQCGIANCVCVCVCVWNAYVPVLSLLAEVSIYTKYLIPRLREPAWEWSKTNNKLYPVTCTIQINCGLSLSDCTIQIAGLSVSSR